MSLVLDASLTLSWYFEDKATAGSEALMDQVAIAGAVVPMIWRYEVANGLLTAIRRRRITTDNRDASLTDLFHFPITIDRGGIDGAGWISTMALADRFGLTLYDAAYVELAERRGLPLASLDQAKCAAAQALGIDILT